MGGRWVGRRPPYRNSRPSGSGSRYRLKPVQSVSIDGCDHHNFPNSGTLGHDRKREKRDRGRVAATPGSLESRSQRKGSIESVIAIQFVAQPKVVEISHHHVAAIDRQLPPATELPISTPSPPDLAIVEQRARKGRAGSGAGGIFRNAKAAALERCARAPRQRRTLAPDQSCLGETEIEGPLRCELPADAGDWQHRIVAEWIYRHPEQPDQLLARGILRDREHGRVESVAVDAGIVAVETGAHENRRAPLRGNFPRHAEVEREFGEMLRKRQVAGSLEPVVGESEAVHKLPVLTPGTATGKAEIKAIDGEFAGSAFAGNFLARRIRIGRGGRFEQHAPKYRRCRLGQQ